MPSLPEESPPSPTSFRVDQALDTTGAARRLGCSQATIRKLVSVGKLPAYVSDTNGLLREHQPEEKQQEPGVYILVRDVEQYLFTLNWKSEIPPDEGWFALYEDEEQNPTEGSEALLNRVRSLSGMWHSLGMSAVGTSASARPGQLSLFVDIGDDMQPVALACLRVDYLGTSISAAWISASFGHFSCADVDITQVDPHDSMIVTVSPPGSTSGLDEAIGWLEAQLRRPLHYFQWTKDGETIARLWMLTDTGRGLVVAGPRQIWQDPRTADFTRQLRS
jgi:hypothetical protein